MITTTLQSENAKLYGKPGSPHWKGHPIAATARRVGDDAQGTCPSTCPLLGQGCYAATGNMRFVSNRSVRDDNDAARVAQFVRDLPRGWSIRHHTAGDIGAGGKVDREYLDALLSAHEARPDLTAWTYTHFYADLHPGEVAGKALVINASANDTAEAADLVRQGWKAVVAVVPSTDTRRTWTEDGVRFVTCPNQLSGVACVYCKLCAQERDFVIAFRAHGSLKKRVDASLTPLPMAGD